MGISSSSRASTMDLSVVENMPSPSPSQKAPWHRTGPPVCCQLFFPSVMLGCAPLEGRLIVADAGRLVGLIGLELDLPEVARVVADTGRVCTLPEDELPAPVEPSTPRAADDTCLTPELGRTLAADAAQDEFAGAERSECAEAGLSGGGWACRSCDVVGTHHR